MCTKTEVRLDARTAPSRVPLELTARKDLNYDALKAQFVGLGKAISKDEFQDLDNQIKLAKCQKDEKAKKQFKREYVWIYLVE